VQNSSKPLFLRILHFNILVFNGLQDPFEANSRDIRIFRFFLKFARPVFAQLSKGQGRKENHSNSNRGSILI